MAEDQGRLTVVPEGFGKSATTRGIGKGATSPVLISNGSAVDKRILSNPSGSRLLMFGLLYFVIPLTIWATFIWLVMAIE